MDVLLFEPLVTRLAELDRKLDEIAAAFASDPDPLGLLDEAEEIIGEGFMRCQLYMIDRKGDCSAADAYGCGPQHKTRHIAQIINTAGNYHKHRGEWPSAPARWGHQQHHAVAVFRDAGVVEDEFWLVRLLERMAAPNASRLAMLIPKLIEWREAFDQLRQPQDPLPAAT